LTAGYATNIGVPYARRYLFKISNGNYDFPACWGYGNHEVGGSGSGYEIDDFERFVNDLPASYTAQSTHIVGVDGGGSFDTGTSLLTGNVIETIIVHNFDFIYTYTNGILTHTVPVPSGASTTDVHHPIINMAVGASWEAYPAGSIGSPKLTVMSVEVFAPVSNATGVFPPPPPTPRLTWGSGFADGILNSPANGTVIASLSGALTYRLIPYLNSFTGLAISGSNVVTVGTPAPGNYDFYIEGTDASGTPCLASKLTATFTSASPIQFIQNINNTHTSHNINLDIVGDTLYLCSGWNNALTIWDITNRASPVMTDVIGDGSVAFPNTAYFLKGLAGVRVVGNYAYCAAEQANNGGFTIIDLTTKAVVGF